jgi:hypothetical protein
MYVFDGETGTVLAVIVNTSLAGAERTPGFHPEARYEFKIYLGDEERESLTYRVTFGESDGGRRNSPWSFISSQARTRATTKHRGR